MRREYTKPEIRIAKFQQEDIIMESGGIVQSTMPKTLVNSYEAASYGTQDFSIFTAE